MKLFKENGRLDTKVAKALREKAIAKYALDNDFSQGEQGEYYKVIASEDDRNVYLKMTISVSDKLVGKKVRSTKAKEEEQEVDVTGVEI